MRNQKLLSLYFCFTFFCLSSILFAQIAPNINPPFNTGEIVQQLTRNQDEINSGEFFIDTNIVCVPHPKEQFTSCVAFDGTNYLVVWCDKRNSPNEDIYGARVGVSGIIMDPNGLPICTQAGSQAFPSIAFDGTNYLVVWQDTRNGPYIDDIYCCRVNQAGAPLDTTGIPISTAINGQWYPAVAFDGTNYLVVWGDARNGPNDDIYGARVSVSGIILDPNGFPICMQAGWQGFPSVAFDGTNYLTVWEDRRAGSNIYGARVTKSGLIIDTAAISISTAPNKQTTPAVTFNGGNYFVVWQDERITPYATDIYGTRVNPLGLVLDTAGIAISSASNSQWCPSAAFDNINYLVIWGDARSGSSDDIYATRVTQSGVVLDSNGLPICTQAGWQGFPSAVFDGTNYLTVWEDHRAGSDIYGARVMRSGLVIDTSGISISSIVNMQSRPSVAYDGAIYLVLWNDYRDMCNNQTCSNIYALRVSQTGGVLDSLSFAVSAAPDSQECPKVDFDNTNYFAVWQDRRDGLSYHVYGARVNRLGQVLDPAGISISTNANAQEHPAIVFDGVNHFIVWQDACSGSSWDIYGTRVTQAGVVIDPTGLPISTAANHQFLPSVTFDGIDYFVVWEDGRAAGSNYSDIYAARVTSSGLVLDPTGIPISTALYRQGAPSVAFDGTNYFTVWQDRRNDSSWDIYGARVTKSGLVLDPTGIAISTAPDSQISPTVIFDGMNYLVAWQDRRNGLSYDVYGARINPSGVVFDSFYISLRSGDQILPSLACSQSNQVFVTYSGWTDYINNRSVNTMRVWGNLYLLGVEESEANLVHDVNYELITYPNPFRQILNIKFVSTASKRVSLKIYDATGRCVKTLFDGQSLKNGIQCLKWAGNDDSSRMLPLGIYFCRMESGNQSTTLKMVKLK